MPTGEASPKDRLALYAEKIEGVFATVFRQAAMFRFEQRCHEARRASGELTAEEFGELWQEEIQAMFGYKSAHPVADRILVARNLHTTPRELLDRGELSLAGRVGQTGSASTWASVC